MPVNSLQLPSKINSCTPARVRFPSLKNHLSFKHRFTIRQTGSCNSSPLHSTNLCSRLAASLAAICPSTPTCLTTLLKHRSWAMHRRTQGATFATVAHHSYIAMNCRIVSSGDETMGLEMPDMSNSSNNRLEMSLIL